MNEVNNGIKPLNQNPNQFSGDTNNPSNNMNDMLNNQQQVNSYNANTFETSNLENGSSNMYSQQQINNSMNYMNSNIPNNYQMTDNTVTPMNDATTSQSPITSRMNKYNTNNIDKPTIDMNNNVVDNNLMNDMSKDIPISGTSLPNSSSTNNEEAKKKGFPIWIIFVILILAVIGGGVYYYFVIDNPQHIFSEILNNKLFGIKLENYEQSTIEYEASNKLMSSDEDMKQVFDIINKISVKGSIGRDVKNKTFFVNLEPMYESKKLLGMNAYYENNNLYIELKDIYDKVLKTEIPEEDGELINKIFENKNKELTEKLISSIKKNLTETLKKVENKKEYVKLDKKYIKKVSIIIDAQTLLELYKNLLNDSDFLENYSKLTETTPSEIKENLEDEIEYIEDYKEDYEPVKISLYLSIITNQFHKAEIISEDTLMTIDKEEDGYSYKIYDEDEIIQMQGDFSLVQNSKTDYKLFFSLDVIEEQVNIEFNIDYSIKYNEEIQKVSTTGSVDINDLSNDDANKIITNISENENLKKFVVEISSTYSYTMPGNQDYLA